MSLLHRNLLSYLAAFDGTIKEFIEVEHIFDAIYHDNFLHYDVCTFDKDQMRKIHSNYLSLGSKATVIHCAVANNNVDAIVKYRLTNEKFDTVIHDYCTIEN